MLIYFLLLLGGGGGRDDTSKSVIVTLSNLWGGATAPPAPPLGTALVYIVVMPKRHGKTAVPYLEVFEQWGSADIVSLISGGAEMTIIRAL